MFVYSGRLYSILAVMTGAQIEEVVTKRGKTLATAIIRLIPLAKRRVNGLTMTFGVVVVIPILGQRRPTGANLPIRARVLPIWQVVKRQSADYSKAWEQVKAMVPAANSEPVP